MRANVILNTLLRYITFNEILWLTLIQMEVASPLILDTIHAESVPHPRRKEVEPEASPVKDDQKLLMNDTQSLIVQLLRKHGGMTRDQLSRRLGLSAMGTSKPLSALSRAGIVSLGRKAQLGPGRPSKSVELSSDTCFSLGITVKRLYVELALVNLQNTVIDFQQIPFSFLTQENDFSQVFAVITKMMKTLRRKALFSVGLSFSGDFEFDTEHILKTNDFSSPGQAELFRRQLSKKLNIPVTLIHDTEACLMAERWCNQDLPPNPTLLHVGDRLGFSLMIDGHLCRGTPHWSRWLGLIQVPFSKEIPVGFLPGALASTADIGAWNDRLHNCHYGERQEDTPNVARVEVEQLYQRWLKGDVAVRKIVAEGARDLALVIRNICLLLPFQRIICTGWIPEIREVMIAEIRRALAEVHTVHHHPIPECNLTVSSSLLGDQTEAAGAALWAIDRNLELKMSKRGWKNSVPKAAEKVAS